MLNRDEFKKIQMNQIRFILGEADSSDAQAGEFRMNGQQVHLPLRPGFGAGHESIPY